MTRGKLAGRLMADAITAFLHLLYNKKTALRVLNALIERLGESVNKFDK